MTIHLGKLNLISFSLAVGGTGQLFFFKHLFPHLSTGLFCPVVLAPWLIIHTITFCKRPPVGARPFANCLIFAMSWYASITILAEGLHLGFHGVPGRGSLLIGARLPMYLAFLSFIPFVRTSILLRRYEKSRVPVTPPPSS